MEAILPAMRTSERAARIQSLDDLAVVPWQGKTFKHESADHGHGVNRLLGERDGEHLGCFFGIAKGGS